MSFLKISLSLLATGYFGTLAVHRYQGSLNTPRAWILFSTDIILAALFLIEGIRSLFKKNISSVNLPSHSTPSGVQVDDTGDGLMTIIGSIGIMIGAGLIILALWMVLSEQDSEHFLLSNSARWEAPAGAAIFGALFAIGGWGVAKKSFWR